MTFGGKVTKKMKKIGKNALILTYFIYLCTQMRQTMCNSKQI